MTREEDEEDDDLGLVPGPFRPKLGMKLCYRLSSSCRTALGRPIVGVRRPLGMLMTAVSRHRGLRWQLCQLHRCLREKTWRTLGQPTRMEWKWCAVERPARMEHWLCAVKRLARVERWSGSGALRSDQLGWSISCALWGD